MSIRGYVNELEGIKREISMNLKRNRELRQRSNQLEKYIADYLKERNQPGVKLNETAVVVKEVTRRRQKNKSDFKESQLSVLAHHNIPNPELILEKLREAGLGEVTTKRCVKFHDIPKRK